MTDGTHEQEEQSEKLPTVPDPSPATPALSKDAWELIQYRLWDHLRGKMWTTLSVFLTLVTVAGLLGVPTFISSRVDAKIADEKSKFEQLRSELAADRSRILTLSSTSSYAALLWVQSLAEFQRAHLELLSDLEKPRYSKDDRARQTWHVFRLLVTRFDLQETAAQFRPNVRSLTEFLDCECVPGLNGLLDRSTHRGRLELSSSLHRARPDSDRGFPSCTRCIHTSSL